MGGLGDSGGSSEIVNAASSLPIQRGLSAVEESGPL